jgi:hypothetical protein
MGNLAQILATPAPASLADARANWPARDTYRESPADWRDEVFYFLLPDRFSDGKEGARTLLSADLTSSGGRAAVAAARGASWNWHHWCVSGATRFQGGTVFGIQHQLDYLANLGVTAIWIAPIFRQRVEGNDYHGYGVQNFLDVDARFGSRQDLVNLVDAAHQRNLHVILDVIFNHSGCNWLYDANAGDPFKPPYLPSGAYDPVWSRSGFGTPIFPPFDPAGPDDYVYPTDLRGPGHYMRAGKGDLGRGDISEGHAEHKRTDFESLRKFNLWSGALDHLIWVCNYWMALADIDGVRIDTLKHVTFQQARDFCNGMAEYAEALGKNNFLLVGEVAGGDSAQQKYLQVTGRNLSACLDIGSQRETICSVAKGLRDPADFFAGYEYTDDMGAELGVAAHEHQQRPRSDLRAAGLQDAPGRRRTERPSFDRRRRAPVLRAGHSVSVLQDRAEPRRRIPCLGAPVDAQGSGPGGPTGRLVLGWFRFHPARNHVRPGASARVGV